MLLCVYFQLGSLRFYHIHEHEHSVKTILKNSSG